ncbi:glutathione S-transferase C-terminal-like protein [Fomitopsis schrenkii]|uniref:glutathione transferase n=1 Tax=Fomitopsis schrenkii TaxID=2126942 RepID=S8EYW8_FOMSC|nr:glutathione S-transferase C-terminal-like protein [Fomitopsis schrenkii]
MSHGKQFTLFTHKGGPNGWKVAFVLTELDLTYESIYLDFNKLEQKATAHTQHNPNGRIPTLIDHTNNDFTVWESNAIIVYLAEKYDTTHRVSAATPEDKIRQLQWLFFQASGQGPYFGQAIWFKVYHHEKVPSAVERYQKETVRVLGVLNGVLEKQEWLVGGKPTVADFAFVSWNNAGLGTVLVDYPDVNVEKDFPAFWKWHTTLIARPSIKKVLDERAAVSE